MYVSSIHIDRFGSRTDLGITQLSNGLNVVCGPVGSGKSSLVSFIRGMWCGFSSRKRNPDGTSGVRRKRGALVLQTDQGARTVRRDERRDEGEELTVEGVDGKVSRGQVQILGDLPRSLLQSAFFVNFPAQPQLPDLLAEAQDHGCRLKDGSEITEQLRETEQMLADKRRQLGNIVSADSASQTSPVDAVKPVAKDAASQFRQQLGERLAELQSQETKCRDELAMQDGLWNELDQQRQVRERTATRAEPHSNEVHEKLRGIDLQLSRWNRMLRDVIVRKQRAAERADHRQQTVNVPAANATPRRHLAALQRRIEESRQALKQFAPGESSCNCQQVQTVFGETLDAMLDDVGQLSNDLSYWQSYHLYRQAVGERDQLARCELELRETIQSLKDRREAIVARHLAHSRSQASGTAQSAHENHDGDLHPIASHASESAESTEASDSTKLNAELVRIDALRHQARRALQHISDEIAGVQSQLRQLDEGQPSVGTAETSNTRATKFAKQRQQLQVEIAKLEAICRQLRDKTSCAGLMETASKALRRLSSSRWIQIECSSFAEIWVHDHQGRRLRHEDLDAGSRDQVYLACCLAVVDQCDRRGSRIPMVLNGAFTHYPSKDVRDALEFLRDFARDRQVLCLTQYEHVVGLARVLNVPVHPLSQTVSSRDESGKSVNKTEGSPRSARLRQPRIPEHASEASTRSEGRNEATSANKMVHRKHVSNPPSSSSNGIPAGSGDVATQLASAAEHHLSEYDPIERASSIDQVNVHRLRRIGILRVGDLLRVPTHEIANDLQESGITADMVEDWQAQVRLMCNVRGLRSYDARILVACGITAPAQLSDMNSAALRNRVREFSATPEGQAILLSGTESELSRVTDWIRNARQVRLLNAA